MRNSSSTMWGERGSGRKAEMVVGSKVAMVTSCPVGARMVRVPFWGEKL